MTVKFTNSLKMWAVELHFFKQTFLQNFLLLQNLSLRLFL
jgi:hypothetical protein